MIDSQPDVKTLAVGCSADSLMQVYIAEMAHRYKLNSKKEINIPSNILAELNLLNKS